ncbi:MAG: hypothetical protein L6461_09625 [Anaerolineae bacterium]|nr:hypothetical protein [Anaerolineae bacterium]
MSLKFKRNLPTLLLLLAFISLLAVTVGGQSIVAYSVQAQLHPAQADISSLGQFFSQALDTISQTQLSLFAR